MNQNSLWKELRIQSRYFLKNPVYMIALVIGAIFGYGYVLTHGTCGADDISIDIYFENGVGVAIGRWPYYLVNKVIPIAKYTPFWGDFVTVLVLMFAAIMWCVLLRLLIRKEVPIWSYIIFSLFFLDYSMNAEVFVFYLQNGIGWVYLFSALVLIAFFYTCGHTVNFVKQVQIRISVLVLLTIAISFYESAANVFLTGALLVIFIDFYVNKQESVFRGKRFVSALFFVARYLVYAMIARRLIRTILMRGFNIPAYTFYRDVTSFEWLTKGDIEDPVKAVVELFKLIYRNYFAIGVAYYPVLIFALCSVAFLVLVVWCAKKNKDLLLALAGLGTYVSMFALCVIEGSPTPYRACQIFTVFVAFVFFSLSIVLAKQTIFMKRVGICAISVILGMSIYDMTKWFVLDYEKTEYEMQILDDIAGDLLSGEYNIEEKPIVVVGEFDLPDFIYKRYCIEEGDFGWEFVKYVAELADIKLEDEYCYGQNSDSIITWSVHAFAMSYGYNVPIRQLFEYRGYEFMWADAEIVNKVFAEYFSMDWEYYAYSGYATYTETYGEDEQYPNEGYIEELEDCIVIKL